MTESDRKNTVLSILRSQKGFSLTELLVTLVLVGLITTAVAGGIAMVARSYTRVVDRADAEQLLSTTVSRITDELSFAEPYNATKPVNVTDENKTVEFVSGLTGMRVRITAKGTGEGASADDSLHMYYYYVKESADAALKDIPLYDSKLKDRMTISYDTITYDIDNGMFTIKDLGVTLKGEKDPFVKIDSYTVSRINDQSQS